MSTKAEAAESNRFDTVKWLLVVALVVAGVAGNSYFGDESLLYRVLGLVVLAILAIFIAFQTARGRSFRELLLGSRTEIRKVVWPSHQETLQTTAIVLLLVIVMALLLWGLDSLLSFIVAKIIG